MLGYRTKDFSEKDITCKCGCGEVSRLRLIKALQALRDGFDQEFDIIGTVRCDDYNEFLGGRGDSYHVKGLAVDIDTYDMSKDELMALREIAYDVGFRGFGLYNHAIHLDLRDTFELWDHRGE